MVVWVVRAGRNGEMEDLGLEQGLVTISWEELPDLSGIQSHEELKTLCQKTYSNRKQDTLTNWVRQIWDFCSRIQKDDLVLLPRKKPGSRGTVAVGRVSGPYRYRADLPPNAYHTRPVEWLTKDLPRTTFDQDLLLSLGIPMTVFSVKRERADERILALVKTRKARSS